jgi:hypothetical protein
MANETKKSLVEEALLQMKNLEEAVTENAKGILASTMKEEISELVKESLSEEDEMVEPVAMEEGQKMEKGSEVAEQEMELDIEDLEDEMDDMESDESEMEDEDEEMDMEDVEDMLGMDLPGDELEVDDEEEVLLPLDLTGASDEEILKVFKAMGEEDGIIISQDDDEISLKDNEADVEYKIQMESEEEVEMGEMGEEVSEEDVDEVVYEIEMSDEDEVEDEEVVEYKEEATEEYGGKKGDDSKSHKDYMSEEIDEDYDDMLLSIGDMMSNRRDQMVDRETINLDDYDDGVDIDSLEVLKDMVPNGMWFDMDGDGMLDPNEVFNIYKEKYGQPKLHKRRPMEGEAVEEEGETTETARTYSSLKKVPNAKIASEPTKRYASDRLRPAVRENESEKELQQLREKNEEYRKALNIFKEKLNEVAVFNSNLAYATRLFTENTTTKQEKINILRRFDSVETLKESKSLYKTLKEEFESKEANTISESVSEKVSKTPVKGSSANLIENKTYENPQFMRMKDLMTKIIK